MQSRKRIIQHHNPASFIILIGLASIPHANLYWLVVCSNPDFEHFKEVYKYSYLHLPDLDT